MTTLARVAEVDLAVEDVEAPAVDSMTRAWRSGEGSESLGRAAAKHMLEQAGRFDVGAEVFKVSRSARLYQVGH